MKVTILIPAPFRRYADEDELIETEAGTIEAVLSQLASRYPQLKERLLGADGTLMKHLAIARNGSVVPTSTFGEAIVADGESVEILFVASGG
jgi:sulfur carrier protein ThiS